MVIEIGEGLLVEDWKAFVGYAEGLAVGDFDGDQADEIQAFDSMSETPRSLGLDWRVTSAQ